jgi:uncharacterized protein YndB with AHSA1/START domain
MTERPVGKTKDVGWQIGVSRTILVDFDTAWRYLTSPAGLSTWLGEGIETPLAKGQIYKTNDGTTGQVRSVRLRDRIRLTWQPSNRPDDATVQIALTPAATGCTFRFHTERLCDADERERMRRHWLQVANTIESELTQPGVSRHRYSAERPVLEDSGYKRGA